MSKTFIRDALPRIQYAGDGVRTSFELPFQVLAGDDLLVFVDDRPATGFSISGLGEPACRIVFLVPPTAGTTVTCLRRTEGIRETAFVDGGPFRAAAINAELDRITMLIQENREEHNRALRAPAFEGDLDFGLPPAGQRANHLLGFDSSGKPVVFGQSELPIGGDASGQLVTPAGATTARALGEHLASIVNVRDYGAIGDGVSDDSIAFQAALAAAQARSGAAYVPAGTNPYVIGTALVLDGVSLVGDGPGSMVKLALATGPAIELTGHAPRLEGLRLLGPGANTWPQSPQHVDLDAVTLTAVRVTESASEAVLHRVEIAACHTALAIEGPAPTVVDCSLAYCINGSEAKGGATGSFDLTRTRLHACSLAIHVAADALLDRATLNAGEASLCGRAIDLVGPSGGQRAFTASDLRLLGNLDADVRIASRHIAAMRGCHIDAAGRRHRIGIELLASGEPEDASSLIVENTRAEITAVVPVILSGGTNLDLLEPGDLVVLASDGDDVDDLWTTLKATRAGVVQEVVTQTADGAQIALASAANRPLVQPGDVIRIAGRFGTATVDSVGGSGPASTFAWLRADDHSRVFAAHNPMPADQIELAGDSELRHFPGLTGEPVAISRVELNRGAVNGALTRLVTLEVAQNTAVSFTPDAPVGMVHAFGHGSLGDPSAAVFSYRTGDLGYTQLIGGAATVHVQQGALSGTTGQSGSFTYSSHSDGKIYVENRMSGPPRKVSLFVVGAPL